MTDNTITQPAPAPRDGDAAEIRELLAELSGALDGDFGDWPQGRSLVRQVTAYLDGEASRLPARAGSPALRVIAAIPQGTGREIIAVVEQPGPYPGGQRYGTVRGYRNDLDDGTVRWSAEAGHYDYLDLTRALRGMCSRAGIKVVWPDPAALTPDMVLAQRMAETMWAIATSTNHAIAVYSTPVYLHMEQAFLSAVQVAYSCSRLTARRVRDLLAEYGPDESLQGTSGSGVWSYVRFAQDRANRRY